MRRGASREAFPPGIVWVCAWTKKADFTNEMDIGIGGRTGQKQWASVPMLLKTAIHGGFSLVLGHFISEMTAFSQ